MRMLRNQVKIAIDKANIFYHAKLEPSEISAPLIVSWECKGSILHVI